MKQKDDVRTLHIQEKYKQSSCKDTEFKVNCKDSMVSRAVSQWPLDKCGPVATKMLCVRSEGIFLCLTHTHGKQIEFALALFIQGTRTLH